MQKNDFLWKRCGLNLLMALMIVGIGQPGSGQAADETDDDIELRESFAPGVGKPVGDIVETEGESIIVHSGERHGYRGQVGLPVFMGDAIITREKGRITIRMADESQLNLSPSSKIVLNRALYDPDAGERRSYIDMAFGKTRFVIKKMMGFKNSDVKVKTKTAVLGVRGSDFVVSASGEMTEIAAFDETILEVTALHKPELMVILRSFQRVRVDLNGVISAIERLLQEDIDRIRQEFAFTRLIAIAPFQDPGAIIIIPVEVLVDPTQLAGATTEPGLLRHAFLLTGILHRDHLSAEDITRALETHREGTQPLRTFKWPDKPQK